MFKADEIMDVLIDTLEQSGYKIEDVHLINYDTWKSIEKIWKEHLDQGA